MAVAGRVAIKPMGAFDIERIYKRLEMVKYQNTLFIAKKEVGGVIPVDGEYWMDCGGTDLSDIEKKISALEKPEFTEAEELEGLESRQPNSTLWGRVAKAVSSLIAHLGNTDNPHEVTAEQTGALTKDNIINSTVVTEAGKFTADAVQLNKTVEGSYAAGVAEEISGINADLAQNSYNFAKNVMIPYLYNFAVAEQPIFVLSENIGDRVEYRGRGVTRTSNEKAFFVKVYNTSGGSNPNYYGYGVLSAIDGGIAYKDASDQYSTPTSPVPFRTPKGNTVYFQRLNGMFSDNGAYNVVATINGTEYIIKETTFSTLNSSNHKEDIQLFLLTMCDFYLF